MGDQHSDDPLHMAIKMIVINLILGVLFLYLGAEGLIRGGSALAVRLGIPVIVIGLTIVAFGTSAPELVVSVQAGLEGRGDIAIGNVIGSNIVNTSFILGFCAMLFPLSIHRRLLNTDTPLMILIASVLFGIFLVSPVFTRFIGILFLSGLVVYTVWSIANGMKTHIPASEPSPHQMNSWIIEVLFIIGGLVILLLGSHLFLLGAVTYAQLYGVSDRVIGLTIVAIGTSLPELAASLVAAFKNQGDIAIGNLVGSSIFNMLGIIGAAAAVSPIHVENINWIDFVYMIALFIGLWVMIRKGTHITRWEGAFLFFSYLVYLCYLLYF